MDIKYFCAWWGLDHLGMEGMLHKIKEAGDDGIEVFAPLEAQERDLMESLLEELAASLKPVLINSHTGRDFWSMDENGKLIEIASDIESSTGN